MPPRTSATSAYREALLEARASGFRLSREAVDTLTLALRDAVRELERVIGTDDNALTSERARSLLRQIKAILATLDVRAAETTARGVNRTAATVMDLHAETVRDLVKLFAPDSIGLTARLDRINVRAVQALASRTKNAATFKTLMHRNVLDAAKDVDRLLISAVSRGVSSRTLAKDLRVILSGGFTSLEDYGFQKSDLAGLRTLRYDASRIARTEINNALREANAMAMRASPIVVASQWSLSGNHGEPDECDVLASSDFYGFGDGFYPPDAWPVAPHPNCGCMAGAVKIRPVSEWGDPKPASPAAQMSVVGESVARDDWSELRQRRARATVEAALRRRAA